MYIHHYLQWQHDQVSRDGQPLFAAAATSTSEIPQLLYREAGISYPKFFKMDLLSKVAFLAAEWVVPAVVNADKNHIATVVSTGSGCLDVDKRFEESRAGLASPALFVYTLPNIMLGEICIRHGFKGEQVCTVAAEPDPAWLSFCVSDQLQHRGTEACLCGHVEAVEGRLEACLLWVSAQPSAHAMRFNQDTLKQLFNTTFT